MQRAVRLFLVLLALTVVPQCAEDDGPVPVPPPDGPKPDLVAVIGVRATTGLSDFTKIVRREMQGAFRTLGVAAEWIDATHLPIHARVFRAAAAGTFMVELETAAPLDAEGMSRRLNADEARPVRGMRGAWVSGRTGLRQLPPENGRSVLLVGDLFGTAPQKCPWFHHRLATRLSKSEKALLAEVDGDIAYALVRGMPFVKDDPRMAQVMAMVGPKGLVAAFGLHVENGSAILDQHYGLRVGRGMIGSILPKDAGDAQPLLPAPFAADMALHINLGPSVARTLKPYLGMLKGRVADERIGAIRALVSALTGELTVYSIANSASLIALGIDPESTKEVDAALPALREAVGKMTEGATSGIERVGNLVKLELQKSGVELAKPSSVNQDPFHGIHAPVKLLGGPGMLAAFRNSRAQGQRLRAADGNSAYTWGYQASTEIAAALFHDQVVVTVRWDKTGTHVRMRL